MKTDYSLLQAALIGYQHQKNLLSAKIAEIQSQLADAPASAGTPKKSAFTSATRKRMAQAQRKRWAKFHKAQGVPAKKRTMSAEGRERIAEATRKRWAEFRAKKATGAKKPRSKKKITAGPEIQTDMQPSASVNNMLM